MGKIFQGILGNVRPRTGDFTAFISVWKTDNAGTSANDEITLPLTTGPNNFDVDWGDGTQTLGVTQTTPLTHSYSGTGGAGTYIIVITGQINGFRFANGGDKSKIIEIKQWGTLNLGNLASYFYGCDNLIITASDDLDTTGTTNFSSGFRSCTSLTNIPSFSSWDVDLFTNTNFMFLGASSFNGTVPQFDNVTSCASMFAGASSFAQALSGNFPSATSATGFLNNADSFNLTPPSFSNVTSYNSMFANMAIFNKPVTLSSTVTVANNAFQNCSSFNSAITVNGQLTNITSMLTGTSFDQDISSWDVTQLTTATNFLLNETLSTANYDALLIAWESQSVQNNVTIHFGNSQYTSGGAAETARTNLINDHSWIITDGGSV